MAVRYARVTETPVGVAVSKWSLAVRAIRWLTSLLILAIVAGLIAASYVSPEWQRCSEDVAPNSTVVRVCSPVGLADGLLIAVVVLLALLLYPDLSEISVAGLGSIRRQIREQTELTKELSEHIQTLQVQVGQSQSLHFNLAIPDLVASAEQAQEKDALLEQGQAPVVIDTPREEPRRLSPDRALDEARLLASVTDVDRYLRLALGPWGQSATMAIAREAGLDDHSLSAQLMSLRGWANVFRDELRAFEVLRDTVRTHPERLADEDVRAGIQLSQSLLDGARRFILQANAHAQREAHELEATVRQWLSEGGWKLVEHRGSGADIVAERAEERLVVEVRTAHLDFATSTP